MEHLAKLTHYQKEMSQFKSEAMLVPRRIQIDPVSFCNHDCHFCTYRYTRDKDVNALFDLKDMISRNKMIEIFNDCARAGVKAVELTGGGEPSLHPQFVELLSNLNERGLDIGLITNGAWRPKDLMGAVRELRNAEWVRFSLDAATVKTHQITHSSKQGDFDRAIAAIKYLVGYKVTVGISFIVQKQNVHEIEDAVRLAESLGVDYIRLGGVMFEGERIDTVELSREEHEETIDLVQNLVKTSSVEVWDNFTDRSCADYGVYNTGDTCYLSYLALTIGADLRVYPCCIWKYRPDGVIADLKDVKLTDIWEKGLLDKFYEGFDLKEKCVRCFFKDKNDFIARSLISRHVNFP